MAMPRYGDYQTAEDFFEATRAAAQDADRISRTIEGMESREGMRAQTYEAHGRSGGTSDPMRRTDARLDYESRIRRRREEDYALIDLACGVLYGNEDYMSGGLAALLGAAEADCMWWRYCAAASWPEVAREVGMSDGWCRHVAVPSAMETVDAYGLERVANGLGLACE